MEQAQEARDLEQVEADKKDDEDRKDDRSSGISNRKKQIERLQKKADRIEKFLKENAPKIGKQGRVLCIDETILAKFIFSG